MNVFHAGDGNLHPLIVFDRREPGVWERVYEAGNEILTTCIDAGGVLTGEHGVGIEKRDLMPLMFSADDLDVQAPAARRVRSRRRREPAEGAARAAAAAASCSACRRARGSSRARRGRGRGTGRDDRRSRLRSLPVRRPHAMGGREPRRGRRRGRRLRPASCATNPRTSRSRSARARRSRRSTPRSRRTVRSARSIRATPPRRSAGIVACGLSGIRRLRHGPLRDHVLEVRFVTADGRLVKGGGQTVKNVTGYDLPRLLVGSFGTLGVLVQLTLRCRPRARVRALVPHADEPPDLSPRRVDALGRPPHRRAARRRDRRRRGAGGGTAAQRDAPALPTGRAPGPDLGRTGHARGRRARALDAVPGARWCAELGVGTVHVAGDDAAGARSGACGLPHAHDGWLLREAGGDGIDGFGCDAARTRR